MSYLTEVNADSPVSHWRLGESVGTTATDTKSVQNGTYNGTPTLGVTGAIDGDSNTAVTFDNTDDYVNVPDHASHDFGTANFSVEAWFKRSATGDWGIIASKRAHTGSTAGWYLGFDPTEDTLRFSTHDGTNGTTALYNSTALQDGQWHHVVAVRSGTNHTLYVDGVSVSSASGTAVNVDSSVALRIGRLDESTTFFDGSIDEVAVYNTALTATRVAAHFNAARETRIYSISAVVGAGATCSGVTVTAGSNIQTAINANPIGTTFCLEAGTYTLTSSLVPKDGQSFIGIQGSTILTGNNTFAGPAFDQGGDDVTIRNLKIINFPAGFRGPIIDGQTTSGWVIENTEVSDCGGVGIWMGSTTTVSNCTVLRLGHMGMAGGGTDSVVENTEVGFCNTEHFGFQHEAGGSKFVRTTRLVVRDCWFHDNYGSGIWYDIENLDGLIEGNLVEDNRWMGIFYEISFAATIRNNIVRRNALIFDSGDIFSGAAGILISTSENVEVYGNIVEDNVGGISMYNRPGGDCPSCDLMNVHVHDNIIRYNVGVTGLYSNEDGANPSTIWNNRWTNNTYYLDSFTALRFQWPGLGKTTKASWQGAGQDTTGTFNLIGSGSTKSYSQAAVLSATPATTRSVSHQAVLTAAVTSYTTEVITDTPVSYWRLGEASGTVATDTRSIQNGTYTGGVTLGITGALTGDSNTAVTVDNTNDFVDIADNALHDFGTADFSVEAWFKRTETGDWGAIVSKGGSTALTVGWYLGFNSSNDLIFLTADGALTTTASLAGVSYLDGQWHHVVGTRSGTTHKLYVDGAEVASGTGTARNVDTTVGVRIGRIGTNTFSWFNGSIDEVAVYNTALSSARVAAHHTAGVTGTGGGGTETFTRTYSAGAELTTLALPERLHAQDAVLSPVVTFDVISPVSSVGATATIAGTAVELKTDSLGIDDTVSQRSTARFIVKDDDGMAHYAKGQAVTVTDSLGSLVFGGFIETVEEVRPGPGTLLWHSVACIDNHYLADKRIVAKSYQSLTAAEIATDLIASYLADEGVTAGIIENGPTITTTIFDYVSVAAALDLLAEKANFWWYIDHDRKLHFRARESFTGPWDPDEEYVLADSVRVGESAPQYRNRQYIKGGRDKTDPQVETLTGDGTARSFVVGYPLAEVPTITLNGTAQTVGIKGVETGKDFYWSKDDPVILQDFGSPALTSSDTLAVTYRGLFPVIVRSEDPGAVAELATIEGIGTGYVEHVDTVTQDETQADAFASAAQKLARFAKVGKILRFSTFRKGLLPGHLVSVTLADHDLNAEPMLVQTVRIDEQNTYMVYTVTAVAGPDAVTFSSFFRSLATIPSLVDLVSTGTAASLGLLTAYEESVTWTESDTTPTVLTCDVPGTGLFPSTSRFPC